jgi:integrase
MVGQFCEYYSIQLRLSFNTIKEHRLQVVRLKTYLNGDPLTTDSINAYLIERSATVSANEFRKTLSSLRRFTRDYTKDDALFEIVSNFRMPKSPTNIRRSIPDISEIRAFYGSLDEDVQPVLHAYLITGLRARELINLAPEDIDEDMRCIFPSAHSADSRTKHSYFTFYTSEFVDMRGSIIELLPFPSYRRVTDAFREASMKNDVKISPQVCRQWFSTTLYVFSSIYKHFILSTSTAI